MKLFSGILFSALLFAGVFSVKTIQAQEIYTGALAQQKIEGADLVRTSQFSSFPSYIHFRSGNEISIQDFTSWMKKNFISNEKFTYKLIKSEKDKLGHVHYRYQQLINGFPVESGIWIVHTKGNKIYSMNGLWYKETPSAMISLSEESALGKALAFVNAKVYKWEIPTEEKHIKEITGNNLATHFPKGEMIYSTSHTKFNDGNNRLCWKFTVYAHQPLYKTEIFVDAVSGEIINEKELIHEADVVGTAVTSYSGTQPMTADSFAGGFRLRESGRGNGIFTYNMLTGTDYGASVDFTDSDNFWNNVNPQMDEVATDAHWGAEMTYDYFMLNHSRNSIDGAGFALYSYVHYDVAFANAFWDGSAMTYGDGSGSFNPFTALDIAGHEISHGLTTFTADLVYQDEPGALNESFSDIFGVAVEWFANPSTADWLMGEDIGTVIRSMSNPNAYGDPDTYFGTNWAPLGGADNGGVHTNSGVQNFWFYLLVNGGTGTNDNGDAYNVTGLGLDDAGSVAFRNLTVYLTNSSQYADARFYAIQSAIDLFGGCSPEVEAVTNAWYAVGVGNEYVAEVTASFSPNTLGGCTNPLTVNFANSSSNGITYEWTFGDGGTSTASNPSHTYTSDGVYTVTLIADGSLCGRDTITVTNQIYVGQLPDPIVTNGGRCDAGPVDLFASGSGQLSWFTVPTGGTSVATGNSYTTPSISTTTTYYVESATGLAPQNVGPVDNTFAGGGYFSGDQHLVFNAYRPFTLNSVWVDAGSAGNRTIELRDNTGAVIQSAVINIPAGQSRVTLNFNVPVGTNLQLGTLDGSSPNLYRNNAGAAYPYEIPGLVSITNSSATVAGYYYFFYDWEIEEEPCQSARVPVVAGISTTPITTNDSRCGAGIVNLAAAASTGSLNWYTAPTGGTLVNTGPTFSPNLSTTTTYYVEEDMTPAPQFVGEPDNTYGGGGYFNGDQHQIFDVTAACTLQSVRVYAGSAGNRTIELRDNTGTVLQSATINIPSGDSRITLAFPLSPGTGYQLGWTAGSSPNLYRNNSGTTSYPYTIAGLVSMTSSSAGNAYYYAYYDWEILEPGCITARTPVTGTINTAYDATITSPSAICAADAPTNLSAVDAGGTWSGTGITDAINGTFDPTIAGIGIHTISYTISGTCGDVGTLNMNVTNTLDATITSSTTICTGDGPVLLTAANGGGTWTGTGITNSTTGEFDPSVGTGIYNVIYTISGACGDADTSDFTVTLSPDASILPISNDTTCVDLTPIQFTSVNSGGIWNASCGSCINSSTGEFIPDQSGTWIVTYTISGTCSDTDTTTIFVEPCVGINESLIPDFSIFPNPANETINVNIAGQSNSRLVIMDGLGQIVYQLNTINENQFTINVGEFAKGIYFVSHHSNNHHSTQKLIIQ